jgi:DNA-binding CsgD family transcriptional regulator
MEILLRPSLSSVSRAAGGLGAHREPADDPFGLTPREADVKDLLARALTNSQIAERRGLSGSAVGTRGCADRDS